MSSSGNSYLSCGLRAFNIDNPSVFTRRVSLILAKYGRYTPQGFSYLQSYLCYLSHKFSSLNHFPVVSINQNLFVDFPLAACNGEILDLIIESGNLSIVHSNGTLRCIS